MNEYTWDKYQIQEGGTAETFKFARVMPHRVLGFLKKGAKKRQGWHVHKYRMADSIARLPHTLTLDEAQDAAKLILLSLKQTGSEGQS
jgi:hypothetical protein